MNRKIGIILLCIVVLASGMSVIVQCQNHNDIMNTDITYLNGDWIVNDAQIRENVTIVLKGNLTIQSGGNLTFRNVTLQMNSTVGLEYRIDVQSGGALIAMDNDNSNVTESDATRFMRYNPSYTFFFSARPGSMLIIRNSIIQLCGRTSAIIDREGLYIGTDNAWIDHCRINNTAKGVYLYNSDAMVSNNTIEWCDTGVRATWWSNGTIENNIISWSDTYGILSDGWDNTVKKISNPLIKNNTIYKTGREGINSGVAIQIQTYSNPTIEDTNIIDWGEDAIFFGQWCQAIVNNCTFDAQGGNYALASSAPRNVTVINSTIVDNNVLWDISLATAYYKMTNCTFNQSKVIFQGTDSNLTVNWFLNSYVNDTYGKPISNAILRIRDNANGTFDKNYSTDSIGYVNWAVLKEYFQKDINGDKDGDDPGERIDYGPYNLTVTKPGYSTANASVSMNESKSVIITLTDIQPPVIYHVPTTSTEIGLAVNITADVTDNEAVNSVYLNYTGVNGTNYNVSMNRWGDNWSYEIPGQSDIGTVDYFIWANDTSGNANMTGIYQIQIVDVEPPEINHVPVVSANVFDAINITANVTDDIAVNEVFLNYTGVSGTNINVSMNGWDGNFSYDIPGQSNTGFMSYFIWVNDSSDNDNMTQTYQIQIFDITDPEINHNPITSANVSVSINITANVTDDVSVNSVYLNYTGVNGTHYNVSMIKWNGNYSYEIPGQNTIGSVQYFIWANDSDGNDNRTIEYSIQINDVVKPEIEHMPVASANVSEVINITAQITDDVGVDKVVLNYTDAAGNNYNVSMNKYNDNWSYEITGQDDIGIVSYFIWANDTSGNDKQTQVYQVQINDVVKPEFGLFWISNLDDNTLNVSIEVTDDVVVDSVYLNYTDLEGINHNVSMTQWFGNDNWSYSMPWPYQAVGEVLCMFWANDTSDNENISFPCYIMMADVYSPSVISHTPSGINVSITTTITITFNESMNTSSVQSAITISLNIETSYIWNVDNTTLTITPSANLSYNTTYNVTVGIGAKDVAGNGLENPYSWEFTTEIEEIITNGHDDNWLSEYWWVILIIIVVTIIVMFLYWRTQKEKEPEEKTEESEKPE